MIVTTVTLLLGSQRIGSVGATVSKLTSVATLGSVSVILAGKVLLVFKSAHKLSGTMAEGSLKATALWTHNTQYSIDGPADSFKGSVCAPYFPSSRLL